MVSLSLSAECDIFGVGNFKESGVDDGSGFEKLDPVDNLLSPVLQYRHRIGLFFQAFDAPNVGRAAQSIALFHAPGTLAPR